MNNISAEEDQSSGLKPPSKLIVNLYSLLAVLLVLIPEWIAEIAITIGNNSNKLILPSADSIWFHKPDLILSRMSIKELRLLAYDMRLINYSSESKESLSKRLLKKLKKSSPHDNYFIYKSTN